MKSDATQMKLTPANTNDVSAGFIFAYLYFYTVCSKLLPDQFTQPRIDSRSVIFSSLINASIPSITFIVV